MNLKSCVNRLPSSAAVSSSFLEELNFLLHIVVFLSSNSGGGTQPIVLLKDFFSSFLMQSFQVKMVSVGQERMDELDPEKTVFQEISEGS